jgi:GntR family transcriptional regulator of arabinose operon
MNGTIKTSTPPFDQVKAYIVGHIREKRLVPGQRIPTIRSLSKVTGTSPMTVHRAISSLVSEGLLTSQVGSGCYLAETKRKRLIGVLNPHDSSSSFLQQMNRGIEEVFAANDYQCVFIYDRKGEKRNQEQWAHHMLDMGACGIVCNLLVNEKSPIWSFLGGLSIPVVCVDELAPGKMLDGVTTNNLKGGRLAAEHLVSMGHKKIALISLPPDFSSVRDRLKGFMGRLEELNVQLPAENQFISLNISEETINKWAVQIAEMPKPLAVFAIHDGLALEFMLRFKKLGIKVPEEISVMGYDDSESGKYASPALTTVRQYSRLMGNRAAEILISRMNETARQEIKEIYLEPELIVRDSVRKV